VRILAIRGRNLASLETFAVELERAPLVETRLFSIVGPTGAGKSTLLDALCLALFDRVPRLSDARDAAPLDGELSPRDPRGVLRRGAAEAEAEVDFVGRSGGRFRARWEVWRARGRRDGRLQSQRMRFFGLEPERDLSGKHKTETLDLIASELGLGFDEFRRSVLLAQGDFAAFLEARPEERAALLERMTATQVFSEVSSTAFRFTRELEDELERLEGLEGVIEVATDDTRASWSVALETQRSVLPQLRAEHEQAQTRWAQAEAQARLERAIAEAETELEAAEAAWAAEGPARARLESADRAASARPAWERAAAARRDHDAAREKLVAAESGFSQEQAQLEEATRTAAATRAELASARGAEAEAQPHLDAARRLDTAIAEARATRAAVEAELSEARDALAASLETVTNQAMACKAAVQECEAADRERAAHEHAARLEAGGEDARVELDRLERAAHQERKNRTRLDEMVPRGEALARASESAREAHAEAVAERDDRRRAAAKARAALEAHRRAHGSPRERSEALTRLARARASMEELRRVAEDARPRQRAMTRAAREADRQRERLKKARADLRRVVRRDRQLEGESGRLTARLRLQVLRRDLAAHRHALLETGEACPLCGTAAEERPPAPEAHDGPTDPSAAEKRLERVTKQREKLEAKKRSLQRAEDEAAAKQREARERADDQRQRIEEAARQWRTRREELTLVWVDSGLLARHGVHRWALTLPESEDAGALASLLERLRALETQLEERAAEDDRLARVSERLREAEIEAEAAAQRAATALESALEAERHFQLELQLLHQNRATAAADRDAAESELRPRLAGWPEAEATLESDPERLPAVVRPEVESLRAAKARTATAEVDLERRTEEAQRGKDALRAKHTEFETVRSRAARARRRVMQLEAERAQYLDGRPVDEVVHALRSRCAAAETAAEEVEARLERVRAAHAAAEALLGEAKATQEARAGALSAAETELAEEIAPLGLDRSTVDEIFRAGRQALDADRERLAALRARLDRARTTVEDRRSQRAPEGETADVEAARAERDESQSRLESARAAVRQLEERLRQDDEARARRAALAPQIETTRARLSTARELSTLIGSADGKKLRTFAQGLTLDALIESANLHLERLRPRYRLMRAHGQDIDLRILDRDLGDEVRTVSTLSGGETFLVSLALALGLSGLSAKNVQVESMFIDEGFGHLDRESLDLALGTLDELQAEGRTIGIVSHVPDLAERIGYVVDVQPTGPGRSQVEVRAT